jgi:hypothetical protein
LFCRWMNNDMKNSIVWDVTPRGSCKDRRSSESSGFTRTTRRHIPQDGILHSHRVWKHLIINNYMFHVYSSRNLQQPSVKPIPTTSMKMLLQIICYRYWRLGPVMELIWLASEMHIFLSRTELVSLTISVMCVILLCNIIPTAVVSSFVSLS